MDLWVKKRACLEDSPDSSYFINIWDWRPIQHEPGSLRAGWIIGLLERTMIHGAGEKYTFVANYMYVCHIPSICTNNSQQAQYTGVHGIDFLITGRGMGYIPSAVSLAAANQGTFETLP